jgi:hypothetical protein
VVEPSEHAALLTPGRLVSPDRLSAEFTDRLEGPYALVALGRNGCGVVVGDAFGLHPLYVGRVSGVAVIANRPRLVAEALARITGRPAAPTRTRSRGSC